MPEIRVRTNGIGGTIENADAITGGVGLTAAGTTLSSAALAAAPALTGGQHWPIVLDPDAELGLPPEIAWVTAHAAGATTATIARGQETWAGGVAARAHLRDMNWAHVMTMCDFPGTPGGMGVLGKTVYRPGTAVNIQAPTTAADMDAANLKIDFLVPPTGRVQITLDSLFYTNGAILNWGLREGTTDLDYFEIGESGAINVLTRPVVSFIIGGLTPGQLKSYKWSHRRDGGSGATAYTRYGGVAGGYGPAIMTAEAVNFS